MPNLDIHVHPDIWRERPAGFAIITRLWYVTLIETQMLRSRLIATHTHTHTHTHTCTHTHSVKLAHHHI